MVNGGLDPNPMQRSKQVASSQGGSDTVEAALESWKRALGKCNALHVIHNVFGNIDLVNDTVSQLSPSKYENVAVKEDHKKTLGY